MFDGEVAINVDRNAPNDRIVQQRYTAKNGVLSEPVAYQMAGVAKVH